MSDLTSRAQGEAERRWPREGQPTTNAGNPVTPQGWLDEGMASGFVLGATWAAAQAPSVEVLTAEVERLTGYLNESPPTETVHACPPEGSGVTPCCGRPPFELGADRMTLYPRLVTCALAARLDRLRAGIEGLCAQIESMPIPADPGMSQTEITGRIVATIVRAVRRALLAEDEGGAGA